MTTNEHDQLRGALANTICNASNYPKSAQPHLLGRDMGILLRKTADAILAAGYRKSRTIETHEDLAKERLTVVLTSAGTIANVVDGEAHFFGYEVSVPVATLALPVTVLWELGESE